MSSSDEDSETIKSWREYFPCPNSHKSNKESAVLKTWREQSPSSSSCSLKINESSQLSKYKSPYFSSGGHNWRLIVYPKGNEKDNGKGFVSMYVELDNKTTPSMDVFAYLAFFVFNKKENKYFSVQDVEVKRFSSSRTVWGLSKVLALETFNDSEKGYVFDGEQCEFGAHVKIASPEEESFDNDKFPAHKFVWSVRDFSNVKQKDCVSKTFSMQGRKWVLKLYPKGNSESDGNLSIYLTLADSEILSRGEMMFVQHQVKVVDPRGANHKTSWGKGWYMQSTRAFGYPSSYSLDELRAAIVENEDTLNVEFECEVQNSIIHPFIT